MSMGWVGGWYVQRESGYVQWGGYVKSRGYVQSGGTPYHVTYSLVHVMLLTSPPHSQTDTTLPFNNYHCRR